MAASMVQLFILGSRNVSRVTLSKKGCSRSVDKMLSAYFGFSTISAQTTLAASTEKASMLILSASFPSRPIAAKHKRFSACRFCTKPSRTRKCWKCHRFIDRVKERFFCLPCNVIQTPDTTANHFEVLGIDVGYDVDLAPLGGMYRRLQTRLHPDKFVVKSETEKEFSVLQSTIVNKAYRTLRKPLWRGIYLLKLHGIPFREGEIQVGGEFLMEVMEINEQLMEIEQKVLLLQLEKDNLVKLEKLNDKISKAFSAKDYLFARELLAHMRYYDNIDEKIKKIRQEKFGDSIDD